MRENLHPVDGTWREKLTRRSFPENQILVLSPKGGEAAGQGKEIREKQCSRLYYFPRLVAKLPHTWRLNSRNVFSPIVGGQESAFKVLAEPCSRREFFLASSSSSGPNFFSLPLASSSSCLSSVSLIRMLVIGFRAHPDNL